MPQTLFLQRLLENTKMDRMKIGSENVHVYLRVITFGIRFLPRTVASLVATITFKSTPCSDLPERDPNHFHVVSTIRMSGDFTVYSRFVYD